jgi:aldehyde dehydrogenase (NAD+)
MKPQFAHTYTIPRTDPFVRATQSGLVHVNRETAGVEPHVPFGGIKGSSSMSREQGKAARQFFTTSKTVYMRADLAG